MSVQFVGIEPEVIDELVKGRRAREVLELSTLQNQYRQFSSSPDGSHQAHPALGQMQMSIPPLAYHYWGQRLGYQCWNDQGFRREFLRDNPGVRVTSAGGTRLQVGYSGGTKRFQKSYG
jgi:hypothetical protein